MKKYKITIIAFLILLVVPNAVMLFDASNTLHLSSKNPLTVLSEFKSHYLENYGSKKTFLNSYIYFKRDVLSETPLPNRIIKGKDNWWFLSNHYSNSLNDVYGIETLTSLELDQIASNLKSWQTYLKKQNIAFYFVVPPDKNKIYKEKLPFQLKQKKSRINQLKDHLKPFNIELIDLTQTELKAKIQYDAYIKNDTHWNGFGAFEGYKTLMKSITSTFDIRSEHIGDYTLITDENYTGDIPRLVNFEEKATRLDLIKKPFLSEKRLDEDLERHHYRADKNVDAMIFHDSFMLAMVPFVSETFKNTRYFKTYQLDQYNIKQHQPKIVILEVVERNLLDLLKLKKPLE